jgi:hypothetical protein
VSWKSERFIKNPYWSHFVDGVALSRPIMVTIPTRIVEDGRVIGSGAIEGWAKTLDLVLGLCLTDRSDKVL